MNTPSNSSEKVESSVKISELFLSLSKDKKITRDQERVGTEIASSANLSLIANRLMNQGSDPESIRMISPDVFKKVAETLGLTEEIAIQAITGAHTRGPASLENESMEEALWLLLASISADQEGRSDLKSRIIQFAEAMLDLDNFAGLTKDELLSKAKMHKEKILATVLPVAEKNGVPVYENDFGFFAAYRKGFKAAMVKTPDIIFVGTTPDTTLEEQKLKVDKQLSPNFGLRFINQIMETTKETRKDAGKTLES